MKYQEAVEEMRRLAGARYWTLDHVTDSRGEVKIHGYIELSGPAGHALAAHTYSEAVANVRRMLMLASSDPGPEDEKSTLIEKAGVFLGTDKELRSIACIDVALDH